MTPHDLLRQMTDKEKTKLLKSIVAEAVDSIPGLTPTESNNVLAVAKKTVHCIKSLFYNVGLSRQHKWDQVTQLSLEDAFATCVRSHQTRLEHRPGNVLVTAASRVLQRHPRDVSITRSILGDLTPLLTSRILRITTPRLVTSRKFKVTVRVEFPYHPGGTAHVRILTLRGIDVTKLDAIHAQAADELSDVVKAMHRYVRRYKPDIDRSQLLASIRYTQKQLHYVAQYVSPRTFKTLLKAIHKWDME